MDKVDEGKLSSFFGEGVTLKGTLKFKGLLRFDGEFEGDITSGNTLIVGASGKIRGNVKIGELYNFGGIEGNIDASNKISLHAESSLFGDIKAPFFATEEGAHFQGACAMPVDKRPAVSDNTRRKPAPAPKSYVLSPTIEAVAGANKVKYESESSFGIKAVVGTVAVAAMAFAGSMIFYGDKLNKVVSVKATYTDSEVKDADKPLEAATEETSAISLQEEVKLDDAPPELDSATQSIDNAREDIEKGRYSKAITSLEEAVKNNPDKIEIKKLLAETYQSVGLEKKAKPYFEAIAEVDPQSSTAINNEAFNKMNSGAFDDAEKLFRKILKSDENDIRAKLGLAALFVKVGADESAVKEYDKILEIKENYAPALNRLAWIYAKQGKKLSDALALSERSLSFSQDIPEYIDTLSEVHYRIGDFDKAIDLIKRAMALAPGERYYERQLFKFERAQKHAG